MTPQRKSYLKYWHRSLPSRTPMLRIGFIAFALFASTLAWAGELRVNLPGRDDLVLDLPSGWSALIKRPRLDLPPVVLLSTADPRSCEIQVTPTWPMGSAKAPTSADIRALVKGSLGQAAPPNHEQEIKLIDLGSSGKPGYYYSATNKAPEPDGFKHLTQGAIAVDELSVGFKILSSEENNPAVAQALEMLRSARRAHSKVRG